jgi:DNA repair exonuclease SbcCD ATPase subunit
VGVFDGKPYQFVERLYDFDHYAIGIERGACSNADGCGLGMDEDKDASDAWEWIKANIQTLKEKVKPSKVAEPPENDMSDVKEVQAKLDKAVEDARKSEEKANAIEAKVTELESQIVKLGKDRTDSEAKLKVYIDRDLEAVKKKKEAVIKRISDLTDVSVEDATKTYEAWSPEQLEHLEQTLDPAVDRAALQPPAEGSGKKEKKEKSQLSSDPDVMGKKLTVGNLMKPIEKK